MTAFLKSVCCKRFQYMGYRTIVMIFIAKEERTQTTDGTASSSTFVWRGSEMSRYLSDPSSEFLVLHETMSLPGHWQQSAPWALPWYCAVARWLLNDPRCLARQPFQNSRTSCAHVCRLPRPCPSIHWRLQKLDLLFCILREPPVVPPWQVETKLLSNPRHLFARWVQTWRGF